MIFTRRETHFLACGLSCVLLVSLLLLTGGIARAASALVNIYDNANVLDATQVEKVATTFPYDLDVYTLSTFEGDTGQLAQYARQHMTTYKSGMVVMMIDVVHRHLAIVDNGQVSQNRVTITDQQYQDAYQAFRHSIGTNNYSAAIVAALQSLENAASQNGLWEFLKVVGCVIFICCFIAILIISGGGSPGPRRGYVSTSSGDGGSSSPGSGSGGVAENY